MVGCNRGRIPRIIRSSPLSAPMFQSALRLLRFLALFLVLASAGRALADDQPAARSGSDQQRAERDREYAEAAQSHGRRPSAPAGGERPARRLAAGGDRRPCAASRRIGEASGRAHPQDEGQGRGAGSGDRRRGRGAREREAEARRARRQPAHGARPAAQGRRQRDPDRGEAARAFRARDLRPLILGLQSAIVGERRRRDPPRRRDDGRDV